jgi:hypothetical protein
MKMQAYKCDQCGALYEGNDKRAITHIIKCRDMDVVVKNVTREGKEIDVCTGCVTTRISACYASE